MAEDRHSEAEDAKLLSDPDEIARREAENGLRQFTLALDIIRSHVKDADRPFKLRAGPILQLHREALEGLHRLAGTFRNTPVKIHGSLHNPPEPAFVADAVQEMCEYVNNNWDKSAVHLAAYVLWKMNWIHPFADGNGRTARAVSYVVMSIKLDSLLPGTPTIPEQIASNKKPYYDALEAADKAWASGKIDVSALEALLSDMLARQLLNAAREATGESLDASDDALIPLARRADYPSVVRHFSRRHRSLRRRGLHLGQPVRHSLPELSALRNIPCPSGGNIPRRALR